MKILFLGGDVRGIFACDYLKKRGFNAEIYLDFELNDVYIERIESARVIILPLPVSMDGKCLNMPCGNGRKIDFCELYKYINAESLIIGGKFYPEIKKILDFEDKKYIDYYDDEEFQIGNALLTAEGAIHYAELISSRDIYTSNIAILGYGRIGKFLSNILHSKGAKITVFARKESDLAICERMGYKAFKIENSGSDDDFIDSKKFDIIFNTIPSNILFENFSKKAGKIEIYDLASAPFCIDESLVKKYNLNYKRELRIPGRYAPRRAGENIAKLIENIIYKEGLL